ncbi:hypothetical protein EON67_09000 [archaeon]|nr:MAG: hypothetical protein EON67_09000 [archaeon]
MLLFCSAQDEGGGNAPQRYARLQGKKNGSRAAKGARRAGRMRTARTLYSTFTLMMVTPVMLLLLDKIMSMRDV